jgi:hypothetical protein
MNTGWTNEPPEPESPAMPLSGMLLAAKERGPGDELAIALARSQGAEARQARDADASAVDPDTRAANMIARGVLPGQVSELSRRLGDTLAGLQAEQEKIERGQRRQERIQRDHQAGRITAFDIAGMDFDEGDPGTVERLERRADSLRRQIGEAAELMAPQRAPEDPLEAASRRAHEVFREMTRAKLAAAEAGLPAPRPFASAGRGSLAVRSEDCIHCAENNVSDEDSYLLHSDPEFGVPVTTAAEVEVDGEQAHRAVNTELCRNCRNQFCECNIIGRGKGDGRVPMIYR